MQVSLRTVINNRRRFYEIFVEGKKIVKTFDYRTRAYLTLDEEREFLQKHLKEAQFGGFSTIKKLKLAYEELIGKTVAESTIYRLLARHNWSKKVPRKRHSKADKEAQTALKKMPQTMLETEKILKDKNDGKQRPFRLMFQDEGRFGHIESPHGCWCPIGLRPEIFSQVVREYTYAFAAVSPLDGSLVSLVLPYANSDCMSVFLEEVSSRFKDEYIGMVCDQAS